MRDSDSPIWGCLLGTAVADALGLPYEGVSRSRAPRLLGPPHRHRFLFGTGMVSDDTEHTCLVAQSLITSGHEPEAFERNLAARLRWWFLTLPCGMGRATLRACVRLWFGLPGGVRSAGNGPSMRAAIFGATIDDLETMCELVRRSSQLTHSDPKAEYGAVAIALATHTSRRAERVDGDAYLETLRHLLDRGGAELVDLLEGVVKSVAAGESTRDYAAGCGLERGVTGYTYHTVPVAIHAWLSHPADYEGAVTSVIECGGDADTTGAIVGGIVATRTGVAGIPDGWIAGLRDWPMSQTWMRRLALQLEASLDRPTPVASPELSFVARLFRNLLFLVVVLVHGFRRLLPPY